MIETEKPLHEAEKLRRRSKMFAYDVVRLVRTLPATEEARVIGRQLLRSGMSVAANYRAVSRSRSRAEFISKIGTVIEETDESLFWLEALSEMGISRGPKIETLLTECAQLVSIFVASQRTGRRRASSPMSTASS
ncbi:MAG TPA: four helix bundle protein [Thermoanaerobaculia bacterium]|nr:four helix bundle protein [Thermoanaerobaculia bacterium]